MFFIKKREAEETTRETRDRYSVAALRNRIRPIKNDAKSFCEGNVSLNQNETKNKLVFPLLAVFGWGFDRIESDYCVGASRKRADIALRTGDGHVDAIIEVINFGKSIDDETALQTLKDNALESGAHLAILTNGSVYRFYSIDTSRGARSFSKCRELSIISRSLLGNRNRALVDHFVCERYDPSKIV